MRLVNADGIEIPQGATVLAACELAGKEIPHFCYHERVRIAGIAGCGPMQETAE